MILLQQMLVMFCYMCIGYGLAKKNIFDAEMGKKLGWLVINVANPALAISAVVNGEGNVAKQELAITFGVAVVLNVILFLISMVTPILFRVKREEHDIYKAMTIFNNIGYMGFPIMLAAYGSDAILYANAFMIVFNILAYTYGMMLFDSRGTKVEWKRILNIGVVCSALSLIIFWLEIPAPGVIKTISGGLGNLTGPLSMMVIGISISRIRLIEIFNDKKLILFSVFKLIVIPLIGLSIFVRVIDNPMLSQVFLVMLSTPVATIIVIFAQQYDKSVVTATKGVALTTLMSVLTIPLVSALIFGL